MNKSLSFSPFDNSSPKSWLILFLIAIFFHVAHNKVGAQSCNTPFLRRSGENGLPERAYKIISAPDGNLLIGGNKNNAALLMMATPGGEVLWERTFDFNFGQDFIYDMIIDSEGKLIAVGRDQINNSTLCFIMRYDLLTHTVLWSNKFPDPAFTRLEGVLQLPNQNFVVYGMTSHGSNLDNLIFEVNKNNGALVWMKSFNNGQTDVFLDAVVKNNAIYTTSVQRYGGLEKMRASISKLDLLGNQEWTRNYVRDQSANARMYGSALASVNDTLVMLGYGNLSGSDETNYTLQLYATDLNGIPYWAKQYQLPGTTVFGNSIVSVPDGYILQGAYTKALKSEIFLMKVNKQGTPIWAKSIGGAENETGRTVLVHNGYIYFVGHSSEYDTNQDILFGKMTLDGDLLGAACSLAEPIQIITTNLSNPFSGQQNMLSIPDTHPIPAISTSPIAVASPITDFPGCGCQVVNACSNLLVNPSFENGLTGWSVTGNVTTSTEAQSGAIAAKICGAATGSVGQIYPAQAGESYTASIWAKTDNAPNNANAQLRFLNASFAPLSTGSDLQDFYSASYDQYNLQAVAPAGTAYVHLMVWKQGGACVTVDALELCKEGTGPGLPDLTVANVNVPNNFTIQQGTSIPIGFTLSNLGASTSANFDIKIYVSSTPNFTTSSVLLTNLVQPGITANTNLNLSATPIFPLMLPPGSYYIIIKVDDQGTVSESNENNNTASLAQPFNVLPSGNCAIVGSLTEVWCTDNGTPTISADDLTNFKLLTTNTAQNIGYHLVVQQTNQSYDFAYGITYNVTNIPASIGNLNLTLTDVSNPSCSTNLTVVAPGTCSNGLPDFVPSNFIAPNSAVVGSSQSYSYTVTNSGTAAATGSSGLNNYLYLSSDNQFNNSDVLVGSGSFSFNFQPNAAVQYGPLNFIIPANTQAGSYYLILVIDQGQLVPEINESDNIALLPFLVQPQPSGGNIDLSLTVTSPATAPIYSSYPVAVKVTNSGTVAATGVKVACIKPNGVVYTGGNEYTATQGSFGVFTNQEWTVGTLAPGASATLTLNYFLLQSTLPTVYSQVTAANGTDPDSTPNNGTPPTPNEDDEASSTATTPPPPPPAQPDLSLSDLVAPTSISAGIGNFTFTLKNIGTVAVQGNYQIGSFLSTDNVLSANDYAFATIPESNTAVGSFPRTGSYLLPTGFAPGNYYLIVKADVGTAIAEGNENNNTVSSPITVTGVACDGNYVLSSQAEVNAFPSCPVVNGNLRIAGADIVDLTPLSGLTNVTGLLEIQNNTVLTNLQGLHNLVNVGGMLIGNNPVLASLSPLSNLSQNAILPLGIDNNPALTNLNGLQGITGANYLRINGNVGLQTLAGLDNLAIVRGEFLITGNSSLLHVNALSKLASIQSNLIFDENPLLANLNGLSTLKTIGGILFVQGTNSLLDLHGLHNLTSLFGLDVKDNQLLQNLDAMSGITSLNSLRVRNNAVLSDCCGLYPVLSANGVSGIIEIQGNPNGCNNQLDIVNSCTPQGIDLQLTMTTTNPSPSIYTNFPVKLTITNNGGQAATGVAAHFPRPSGVVYVGGNEFSVTKGGFNAFGNQQWFIGTLAPGESASLTVNYFLLTSNALNPYAQVVACDQPDSDSSPNNGTAPTPVEDDEATIAINGFAGNNSGNAIAAQDDRQRLNLDWLYPNPAKYEINLELYSPEDQSAVLDFYDQQGRVVHTMQAELQKGENSLQAFVFDWKSGTYHIIARGEKTGMPAYGRFVKVWEE